MEMASSSYAGHELPILVAQVGKDGFTRWQARIRRFLEAEELWEYVSGAIPPPSDKRDSNPTFKEWLSKDSLARGWLLSTVSDSIIAEVLHLHSTSNELWCSSRLREAAEDEKCDHDAKKFDAAKEETCDHVEKKFKASHMIHWSRCSIHGVNDENKWQMISLPESRYERVPCLKPTANFSMTGRIIDTKMLERNTTYAVMFVYKLHTPNQGLGSLNQHALISVANSGSSKRVCFEYPPPPQAKNGDVEIAHKGKGGGGWLEVDFGHFTNINGRQGCLLVQLFSSGAPKGHIYQGLIVEGMELRPLN